MTEAHVARERDHWDHVIRTPDEIIAEFRAGPDPNTARMLDAVQAGPGTRILDFACGSGVTSAWLASRGAVVTGIDLSPESIRVATEVAARLNLSARFVVADLEQHDLPDEGYDGVVGRYALHHLDVGHVAPSLARAVKRGGVAAFVETMAANPVLRLARRHLVGHLGVARYGTLDEHPLVGDDLDAIRRAFGELRVVTAEFRFLSIFDRQVLRYRSPTASKALVQGDLWLSKTPLGQRWGYHQVLIARRTR
jgi:SAM-dependent methyltransferase